ncbi:MAG TPA: HNH endonuclease family protein [Candidatus Acidoferrales bacterium]|nr:HNH endonuclease family protein [Candidatus Acidoferrales bacterium]
MYEFLGREKGFALDDDDFLRAHWIMYFTYSRDEAGKFASFLLDEHFTAERAGSGDLSIDEIQGYVSSIQSSARTWHAIHFPERVTGLSDKLRRGLERLDRLARGAFEPLMMAALQADAKDTELGALLGAAERFIFLVGRVCQRRADTGDSRFYRLASEVFRREKTLSEATEKIRERTEEFFSLEKATADMRDLFRRGEEGFYGWQGLRYFLFEYEQFLREQAGMNTGRLNWRDFTTSKKDHVSIEHIYPQNPTSGDWAEFESKTKKERSVLLNSLGNMLALSQSRNSKLSNRPFDVKKQDSDGAIGYSNGSYSEIAVSKLSRWTPTEVIERGLSMLMFLENRWGVSLGSHDEKLALLNLREDGDGAAS